MMLNFLRGLNIAIVLSLLVTFLSFSVSAAEERDCSCPKVTCGPCQKKVIVGKEVRFCDWGNINVCKKMVCENVSYYFGCLTNYQNQRKDNPVSSLPQKDIVLDYDDKKKKKRSKRKLASSETPKDGPIDFNPKGLLPAKDDSRVKVGFVYSQIQLGKIGGKPAGIKIIHHRKPNSAKAGQVLYVGDEIVNENLKDKTLELLFEQGKVKITLGAKSKFVMQDPNSLEGRFQPFIHLLYGQIEADVKLKEGALDILSGQVIGRSENGRYLMKYQMVDKDLKVRVESYRGVVTVLKASDLSDVGVKVSEGSYLSWFTDSPKTLLSEQEKQDYVDNGLISPVFMMSKKTKKEYGLLKKKPSLKFKDWVRPEGKDRDIASIGDGFAPEKLCREPMGRFEQCAWSCEGNGKKAKDCQVEKNGTYCVRRVCNAAGQWGQPTPFATSYKDLCPAMGTRVGDCRP